MLKAETWENILFEKNCFIAEGSFAMVLKGKWKRFPHYTSLNSPTIAIKMITESLAFAQQKIFQTGKSILHDEAALLFKCNEEYSVRNMIKVYGMIEGRLTADLCQFIPSAKENDEAIGIILEYFDGKTMYQFLYELKIRLPMEEKLRILCEIISTIHDLHASGIIHGDIKPQNILLSLQLPPSIKVIDFGLSKQKGYDHNFAESTLITAPNFAGTLHYCAPGLSTIAFSRSLMTLFVLASIENNPLLAEVLHEPTRASDIYSFAILSWEILTAKKPFPENKTQFLLACAMNQRPSLSDLPSDTPFTIRELIENCWNQDRKRRFSSADCLSLIQTTYDQTKGGLFDIFFSHAWINKNCLSHVHNFLTLNGYRVWYDHHHMGYSLPESMEKGIQNSKIVLICLNEYYQTRENCLFELKTASRLRKPIVVLLLQSNPFEWITPEVNELCDLKRKKYIDISRLIESYDWKTNNQDNDDNNDSIPISILKDLQNQISELTKLFRELNFHPIYHQQTSNAVGALLSDHNPIKTTNTPLPPPVPPLLPHSRPFTVFLTHDWGKDELDRPNHDRVSRVNRALKGFGINTWFDEERMQEGNILMKMAEGVDQASAMIVFVTNRYASKVNGTDHRDNCKFEFEYAVRQLGPQRMIPVVMEPSMKNPLNWKGVFGANLGGMLYVDLTSDEESEFRRRSEELYGRIEKMRTTLEQLHANNEQMKSPQQSLSSNLPTQSTETTTKRPSEKDGNYILPNTATQPPSKMKEEGHLKLDPLIASRSPTKTNNFKSPLKEWLKESVAEINETKQVDTSKTKLQGKIRTTLTGHESWVICLILLNSNRLVSGSGDNTIKIWDADRGQCLSTLTGHSGEIRCLLLLGDGRLVSGSRDKTIKIWDTDKGQCLSTLTGHSRVVYCLLLLGDGRLVSGSSDNTIKIWDTDRGQCLSTLAGHSSSVCCLLLLGDGRLVSGSGDDTIKIWDTDRGQCLSTLTGHSGYVFCLFLLGDGRLVSGSDDKTIKIWDTDRGQCLSTLTGHSSRVFCLLLLGDGRLVSGSSDNTIKIWDTDRGQCLSTLTGHSGTVSCLLLLGDGRLVSGSGDRTIKIWD